MKKKLRGISAGILLSVCLGFLLAVYAPLELYLPNQSEFWPTVDQLIGPIVFLFLTITVLGSLAFIGLRLLGKLPYYIALLLGFGALVGLYIQGNFLAGGLPPFDGTIYDWSAASPERLKSIAAWIVPGVIPLFVFLKCKRKVFHRVVSYGSIALLLVLVLTLSTLLLSTPLKGKDAYLTCTSKNLFQLSENTNLLVIVMDALDSDYFLQALENNPQYEDTFDDFTYYSDALAAYPYTMHSLPMILTGQWHENAETFAQYSEKAYDTSPLLNRLKQEGYHMGVYSHAKNMFTTRTFEGVFDNQLSMYPVFTSFTDACKQVVKMAGIKYAPWDLKFLCYDLMDSLNYVQALPHGGAEPYDWFMPNLYWPLPKEETVELVQEPCFRFVHMSGAHVPFIYDIKHEIIPIEEGTYWDPVEACISYANAYIKMLKRTGVYDNTILVFMGDHGYDPTEESVLNRYHPTLMIKGIHETGDEMVINETPVSYENVMQGFMSLLDYVPSGEIFDPYISDARRLILYEYTHENKMTEYITTGHARDLDTKKATGNQYICEPYT